MCACLQGGLDEQPDEDNDDNFLVGSTEPITDTMGESVSELSQKTRSGVPTMR